MTALSKIEPALPLEPFDIAIREVNEWRGRCLHIFASAELAVTECLETLSKASDRGSHVRRRHLVGQRYEDLITVLSPGGAFEANGEKALNALHDFRRFGADRAMLCHGSSEVTLDKYGRWTAVFKCLSFKAGAAVLDEWVVRRRDAEKRQKDLWREAQHLRSLLTVIKQSVSAEK